MKRLKRHPDTKSWLFKTLVFVLVLTAAVAGLLAGLAFFTGLCSVEIIEVKGNQHESADTIRNQSGLKNGQNLITVNVSKAAQNLMKNNWIEDVNIERHLLNKVIITVKERKPVVRVNFSEVLSLVDGKGFVIAQVKNGEMENIPVVYAGKGSKGKTGKIIKGGSLKESIELIDSMPERVYATIALCNPFDGRGVVFNTKTGYQIIYGECEDIAKKNELLEAIILDIEINKRNVSYIDVRVPESPVTGQ